MITPKRINEDLPEIDKLNWIFALRTEGIRSLVEAEKKIERCSMRALTAEQLVSTYKSLAQVKPAIRGMKSAVLYARPISHFNDDHIRALLFLCMLSYYVEWRMRDRLRELLFDEHDRKAAQKSRRSVVAPAKRSKFARLKHAALQAVSGLPVWSNQDLAKLIRLRSIGLGNLASAELGKKYTGTTLVEHQKSPENFEFSGLSMKWRITGSNR